MRMTKKEIEKLREAAQIVGEHGAYSSKTVVMLCDELLWAWKQLEAAEKLSLLAEEAKHAVC